jgi:hypothetical protein
VVLSNIAYYLIAGKPLILYVGITTFTLMIVTIILGMLVLRGKVKFAYHKIFAAITILVAILHATLGLLAYF